MIEKISNYISGSESNPQNGFAFFLDNSGSVGGSVNYWTTVQQIISEHGPNITAWYVWNSNVQNSGKKAIETLINSRRGTGGTSPQYVAQQIVNKKYKKIILITDGEVSDYSVQSCDRYLEKYQLEKSFCYIIASGSSQINMSVTCPFTRNCDSQVYSKSRDSPMKKLAKHTPEDFKMLDALEEINLQNFQEKFEKLEGLIIALNMGKQGNIPLKNQLVVMKNRMVKELSKNKGQEKESEKIRQALQKNDLETALQLAKNMTQQYFKDSTASQLEIKITHLINLCGDLRGKYDLNQIKSNRMAISKEAKQAKVDKEVEITEISKNLIDCPIIMEQDIPQILVDEASEPVLLNVDKSIVDDIANCPLRILNYPEIKQKFKSRLSNFIGVKYGDKFFKNPFTQKKILGAIPLGCHNSHVKVGNYTLAQMLTGGKILGNLNMYYAVVWYLIKEGNIQYLKEITKNAEQHLLFRLKSTRTMVSLCGLAQFVTTNVTSDVAVWYCANSGYLNQPTDRDTFRYHLFNMQPLIQMTKLLGYPLVKGVDEHLRRTKLLFNLFSFVKKIDTKQKKEFSMMMQCLYQKCMFVEQKNIKQDLINSQVVSRVIPIDGQATEQQIKTIFSILPQRFKSLDAPQLYYIYSLVDPNKPVSAIFLDFNLTIPPLPKFKVQWSYQLKQFPQTKVAICPNTMRPLYTIKSKTWQEVAQAAYEVNSTKILLKGNKFYQYFILKFKRVPQNKEQLATFFFNRYIINGEMRSTLPYQTEQFCQELINDYGVVFEKGFDFEKVQKALLGSLSIEKRKKIEAEIMEN